jgi:hypothetical protein
VIAVKTGAGATGSAGIGGVESVRGGIGAGSDAAGTDMACDRISISSVWTANKPSFGGSASYLGP